VLYKSLNYDPAQLAPIAIMSHIPNVVLVRKDFPANTVQELIAYAKANPGKVNYASQGIGTTSHLTTELFETITHTQLVHVPYKGTAPALNDLLGAHVQAGVITLSSALPHIRAGTVHALAMFDVKRNDKLPDLPTITELMPNYEAARSWIGLLGPADLPPAVAAKLNGEIVHILQSEEARRVLGDAGLDVVANSQAEFAEMMRKDTQLWEQAATQIGLFSQ
jgi:tripartite-type tricarboxylate transporter receptor subunit TctC